MEKQKPIFVRIDDYRDIIDIITLARQKISHARELFEKLSQIKSKEDEEFERWHHELEGIEHSVDDIDGRILRPTS